MYSITNSETQQEWRLRKLKLKEKIASLAKSDVSSVKDMQDEMVVRLQLRLDKTKEEILAIIAQL